jgi:hypothetical protein
MIGIIKITATYKKWWLNKTIEYNGTSKTVKDLIFHAPPSGYNGVVEFIFTDNTTGICPMGINAYRPRKQDVKIIK